MSDRDRRHYRSKGHERSHGRDRDFHHKSEVKSYHQSSASSSTTSRGNNFERHAKERYDSKRKKHKNSRSRSRDKRNSSERERRHREKSTSRSRSPTRRYDDERSVKDHRNRDAGRRNPQRSRSRSHSRSRSASRERERAREKNKQEVKLQMQRNYEEQLEKMRTAAALQPPVPLPPTATQGQGSRLVEQIQQRKLLFSKKPDQVAKTPASTTVWKQSTFSDDADGKMSAKFKRLMGMKEEKAAAENSMSNKEVDAVKKQQQYFSDLEKQYEVARVTTHTQRGLGLGFGSSTSLR